MKSLRVEHCSDLYNYDTDGDPIVLACQQILYEEHHPILREVEEAAVKALTMGKSTGVDNTPAKLVQAGWEAMMNILTSICNKIRKTGEWPTTWIQSLVIALPKKGNFQLCQNYRTISLISHPSKDMLKIILNRLQPQAEKNHCRRASYCQTEKGHHRANIQSPDAQREIPAV